jgi:translation initiation factor 2 gamma subunit (eIF-2gamma)
MTSSTITPKQQENLKPGIRGKRNTREESVKIMTDIISLAPKHDDFEIMRILGLPNLYKEVRCGLAQFLLDRSLR